MLTEFEADTAEYILFKFGLILGLLKHNKYGCSVIGKFRANAAKEAWEKYHKIVIDTRKKLPGAMIGGELIKTKEGFVMIVEVY